MKIAFHKACETTFLCRKWQICLMKHLEIMPILEASEMISVKFSHEDKDLSILPIFKRVALQLSYCVYTIYGMVGHTLRIRANKLKNRPQ